MPKATHTPTTKHSSALSTQIYLKGSYLKSLSEVHQGVIMEDFTSCSGGKWTSLKLERLLEGGA